MLESVGVYNEVKHDNEISWPVFESHAHLRNQHINVVTICDKFTYECFRYEANFIPLTKQNWKSEIDESHPVMLFLESAWNGNNGEWTYTMVSYKKHLGDPLRKVIKYCQSKNIPVVFWNKEDPTNYEVFIDVAADCDYIFTTDGNILEKYKSRVGHNRVYALPFAAQPAIHNPIRDKNKNFQFTKYVLPVVGIIMDMILVEHKQKLSLMEQHIVNCIYTTECCMQPNIENHESFLKNINHL